jgi:hypothetical protein
MSDLSPARYERKDINVPGLLMAAGGLAAIIGMVFLASSWVLSYLGTLEWETRPAPFPLAAQAGSRLPPEPRLEGLDRLEEQRATLGLSQPGAGQESPLTTYGWVNEHAGIIRIPIDRAMKLLLEQNRLPVRPPEHEGRARSVEQRRPSAASSGRLMKEEEP